MSKVSVAARCVLAATVEWGQNQVGTVTSYVPFTLRGGAVPGQRVPFGPVWQATP
jgi:hypothetical protein